MIAPLLVPLFPTDLSHAGYPLIASFNMSVTSFAFLYLCIVVSSLKCTFSVYGLPC
jgi:hypothetical protein